MNLFIQDHIKYSMYIKIKKIGLLKLHCTSY